MRKWFSSVMQTTMLGAFVTLMILGKIPKWKKFADTELVTKDREKAIIDRSQGRRAKTFVERIRKAAAARGRKLADRLAARRKGRS